MIIEITKRDQLYCADIKDLPGSPYVGLAETKEMAVALVFFLNRYSLAKYADQISFYGESVRILDFITEG